MPAKARVLLMVLIANGITDAASVQAAFDAP
jgi:L-asparaginase